MSDSSEQSQTIGRDAAREKLGPEFEATLMEFAIGKAVPVLYAVSKELDKRPVLQETLAATASDLDGLGFALPWAAEQIEAGRDTVDVVEEIVGVNQPPKQFGPTAEVVVAEFVAERTRIDREWEEDDADGATLMGATVELQHKALLAIKSGDIDPVAAATAALGTEAF